MKKRKMILMWVVGFLFFSAIPTFAGGAIKVAVNDALVEAGEELAVNFVLNGDGRYDVYAAFTGGALGSTLFMFTPTGLAPLAGSMPKFRENIDIGSLSVKERILTLLPKIPFTDTTGLKGVYTFYVALCTPGQLDFTAFDFIQVEIQ